MILPIAERGDEGKRKLLRCSYDRSGQWSVGWIHLWILEGARLALKLLAGITLPSGCRSLLAGGSIKTETMSPEKEWRSAELHPGRVPSGRASSWPPQMLAYRHIPIWGRYCDKRKNRCRAGKGIKEPEVKLLIICFWEFGLGIYAAAILWDWRYRDKT